MPFVVIVLCWVIVAALGLACAIAGGMEIARMFSRQRQAAAGPANTEALPREANGSAPKPTPLLDLPEMESAQLS